MKLLSLLSSFLLVLTLSGCKKNEGELHYMNIYTTTIVAVKCENLKNSSELKTLTLSPGETDRLMQLIKKLKPIPEHYSMDARLFGSLYSDSQKIDFCMGLHTIEIEGKFYRVDSDLRNYIISIIEEN